MDPKVYSDEDFIAAVKESRSLAGVMKKIGIKPVGGNYQTVKRKIVEFDLDISHFSGKAWIPKGAELKKFDDLVSTDAIKKRLIKERGHQCECCRKTMWLGGPITLELDHVNGDRFNNTRENLQLLCPNCHSLTPTFRGKNIGEKARENMSIRMRCRNSHNENLGEDLIASVKESKKPKTAKTRAASKPRTRKARFFSCSDCGCAIKGKGKTGKCLDCHAKTNRKVSRPSTEVLIQEIRESSFLAVGKKYGVSDQAVRKWLRLAGYDPKAIKSKKA